MRTILLPLGVEPWEFLLCVFVGLTAGIYLTVHVYWKLVDIKNNRLQEP